MHLLSDRLVNLVEEHSGDIVKRWLAYLRGDTAVASLPPHDIERLQGKGWDILKHLGQWVSYDTTKEEIAKRYEAEGKDLFDIGVPLNEGVRAMYTLRRALWLFVENESSLDSAFQMSQMLELSDRVILFFDRAECAIIRGYLERMRQRSQELWDLEPGETRKVFYPPREG